LRGTRMSNARFAHCPFKHLAFSCDLAFFPVVAQTYRKVQLVVKRNIGLPENSNPSLLSFVYGKDSGIRFSTIYFGILSKIRALLYRIVGQKSESSGHPGNPLAAFFQRRDAKFLRPGFYLIPWLPIIINDGNDVF